MAGDFVLVNRNVCVNVRHRQFLRVLKIFMAENVRSGVAVESGRLAQL